MSLVLDLRGDGKKSCDGNHNLVESEKAIAQPEKHTVESGGRRGMGQKAIRALILRRPKKRSRPAVRAAAPSGHALKTPRGGPQSVIEGPHRTDTVRAGVRVTGWEEWLWQSFYFRSHSRLRCLGLLPLRRRRRPASCAKLSDRARLATVAPTLSPMPNGKRLSGASGTAEFASSAIAFRIDYWLKPHPECFCESVPSRAMNDARGGDGDALRQTGFCTARRRSDQIKSATEEYLRPRSRAAMKKRASVCAGLLDTPIELFIGRWPT
jgi:hypothetical protein